MADFISLGTAPTGEGGDSVREANTKINALVAQSLAAPGIMAQNGGAFEIVSPEDPGSFNNWQTLGDVIDGLVALGLFLPPVPPPVPTNLQIIGGNSATTLSWNASDGAATYDLQSSSDNLNWTIVSSAQSGLTFIDSGATTTAAPTGLAYYRVRATSQFGVNSAYTSSVNASPWLVYDLTTGVNGTLLTAHTPNINQVGTGYVSPGLGAVLDGDLQITGNKLVIHGASTSGVYSFTKDTGQKDYRITVKLQASNSVRVRYVDNSNTFLISIFTGNFCIFEVNSGSTTQRAQASVTITPGVDYEADITLAGTGISATLDGAHPLSYTISGSYAGSLSSTIIGGALNGTGAMSDIRFAVANPLPGLIMWLRGLAGFSPSTWTDQSGSGNSPTQSTSGNQLASIADGLGGQTIVRAVDAARIMNAGNIQPTNASFCKVALFKCSDLTQPNNLISGSNADGAHAFRLAGSQFPESDIYASGTPVTQIASTVGVGSPQTNWALVILNCWYSNPYGSGHVSPATLQEHLYVNSVGGAFTKFPGETQVTSSTLSVAGLQGSTSAGFVGDIAELLLTNSIIGPTAADVNRLIAKINTTYTLTFPLFTKQVLYIGDSITAGYKADASGASWVDLIENSAPTRWHTNKGQASVGALDLLAEDAQYLPFVACGIPTACTVFAGTNDVALYGQTGSQTYTAIQNFCLALKAAGPCTIVVVGMLPRGSGSVETNRVILNGLLLAGYTGFADGYADVTTIPMGQPGANTNLTYYNSDQTHPNDTGMADLYTLISGVLTPLW